MSSVTTTVIVDISKTLTLSVPPVEVFDLKLTSSHINRHFSFKIKSVSLHPLLWMNYMLDFIFIGFAELKAT